VISRKLMVIALTCRLKVLEYAVQLTCFAFKCNSFIMKHRKILPNEVNGECGGREKKAWKCFRQHEREQNFSSSDL
jgi:hypothetical protein